MKHSAGAAAAGLGTASRVDSSERKELSSVAVHMCPPLQIKPAFYIQIVMGSDIVYDGIDLHAIWNAVDWSLDYTAGAQFVLSHEAGLYASLYTCLLVTKCLQVIATELTRKSISLVLQRKCDGFEEDEWLLAFRAQGGTMGFIIGAF